MSEYTFKRSDQVMTLQSKSSVRVYGQPIHVDPELLFQRLIAASNAIDDRKALFRFELCSYPSALFDDKLMPRAPQKAVLANAIWTRLPPGIRNILLSPMASNIKYTMYSIHVTNVQK